MHARREWNNIFKVWKEKEFQPEILYLTKLSKMKARARLPDKQKLKEFIITRPAL